MLNSFKLIELKSNGEKEYFIEGLVSTMEADDYNDIVTRRGQKAIDNQLKKFNITMDLEHEEWINPNTGERYDRKQDKIPVALVTQSSVTDNGTFVRAKLNTGHPLFESILKSVQQGFLHSFSIAYDVTKKTIKQVGNNVFRFIDDLTISNIGITGNPVNKGATFRVALKSINKNMVEEAKYAELETQLTELKSKVDDNSVSEKLASVETQLTELKACVKDMKAKEDKEVEDEDEDEKKDKEVKSKSEMEALKSEVKELKAVIDKLRVTPIAGAELKSHIDEQKKEQKLGEINFISLM